jgi:hypothetical protein
MEMNTLEEAEGTELPRSVLFLFCGSFAATGTLFFVLLTVRPAYTYFAAQSWVETPCIILESKVETRKSRSEKGRTSTTYIVAMRYSYVVDDQTYQGNRYDLMEMGTDGRQKKQAIVKKYPAGAEKTCYVNPENPQASIINRSASLKMLWGLFPLPFMLIGYVGLWYLIFRKREPSAEHAQ